MFNQREVFEKEKCSKCTYRQCKNFGYWKYEKCYSKHLESQVDLLLEMLKKDYMVMERWQCNNCTESCDYYFSSCEIKETKEVIEQVTGKPIQ